MRLWSSSALRTEIHQGALSLAAMYVRNTAAAFQILHSLLPHRASPGAMICESNCRRDALATGVLGNLGLRLGSAACLTANDGQPRRAYKGTYTSYAAMNSAKYGTQGCRGGRRAGEPRSANGQRCLLAAAAAALAGGHQPAMGTALNARGS